MKKTASKQHDNPSNRPADGDALAKMLEVMTVKELTDGLNEALEDLAAENYDLTLIDAYLAALNQKNPMPKITDTKASYDDFRKRVLMTVPAQRNEPTVSGRRFQRVGRVGLGVALTIICLMSGMLVTQAAGIDILGAVAQWTSDMFSLGTIRSSGGVDMPANAGISQPDREVSPSEREGYLSLQDALDASGVTEFSEPAWFPKEYVLENIEVMYRPDGTLWQLTATYGGPDTLHINVLPYYGEPLMQIQKTDNAIETFEVNGFTVYLLENTNNNTAAWATEHFECYIGAAVEKEVLKQIVCSVYESY